MPILHNRSKTIITLNVPCRAGCDGTNCFCSTTELRLATESADGTRGVREETKKLPGSITIPAGQRVDVPEWVVETPDVKRAVARRDLRLVEQ